MLIIEADTCLVEFGNGRSTASSAFAVFQRCKTSSRSRHPDIDRLKARLHVPWKEESDWTMWKRPVAQIFSAVSYYRPYVESRVGSKFPERNGSPFTQSKTFLVEKIGLVIYKSQSRIQELGFQANCVTYPLDTHESVSRSREALKDGYTFLE
ncbi:hypothetical protein WN48_02331 [Eufriesea mexicana]|nr:hypothetical protein WN48_02331 [Eufriesea mexicana]